MKELNICPSTLQEGYDTYSPVARRLLFNGRAVSSFLIFMGCHSRHPFKELAEERLIGEVQFVRDLIYKLITVF